VPDRPRRHRPKIRLTDHVPWQAVKPCHGHMVRGRATKAARHGVVSGATAGLSRIRRSGCLAGGVGGESLCDVAGLLSYVVGVLPRRAFLWVKVSAVRGH